MGTVGIIVVYAVILGGMWFLLMRPQKKEQKRIQAMLADMAPAAAPVPKRIPMPWVN